MTPDQLSAICDTFDRVVSSTPDFGPKFYQRLSDDYPQTMDVFNNINMDSQHTRFVGMLSIILHRIKDGRPVIPLLEDLGKQHSSFGVKEEDFENFGAALMKVLQTSLGNEFDEDLHDAWVAVYAEITSIMKSVS